MAIDVGKSLYWKTGIDNTGLQRGTAQGLGILKGFAGKVTGMNLFGGLTIAAGVAFGAMSVNAYQFAKDYETAMLEVKTISQAVQDDYEGMAQAIIDLSARVPDSAEQLAKAYYQIVSAGYDGAEGLQLLEASSKAAVAGVSDTLTAADGLTTILNAWKIEAKDVNSVTDKLFQTVKLGKTTFGEISSGIAQVAALASSMGVSFDEISGAVATLTKQGVPTAQAFTQIRSSLISMSEVLGDGWSDIMTYQEGLAKVREMSGGSQVALREMVGRVEAMNAVLGMTGTNAQMAADDLQAMAEATGAAGDAFEIMAQSADNQLKIFQNKLTAIVAGFGDKLKEDVAGFVSSDFVNRELDVIVDKSIPFYAKLAGFFTPMKAAIDFAPKIVQEMHKAQQESEEFYNSFLENNKGREEELVQLAEIEIEKIKERRKENEAAFREIATWSKKETKDKKDQIDALNQEQMTIIALQELYEKLIETKSQSKEADDDSSGGTGSGGDEFTLDDFKDMLREAEQGYLDWQKVKKAGLEQQARDEFTILLQEGENWKQYLDGLLDKYKDNAEARKLILIELADESIRVNKEVSDLREKALSEVSDLSRKLNAEVSQVKSRFKVEAEIDWGDTEPSKEIEEVRTILGQLLTKGEVEKLDNLMVGLSNTFGMLANELSDYDSELSRVVSEFAGIASGAAGIFAGIASGDALAIIQGVIQGTSSLAHLFAGASKEAQELAQKEKKFEGLQRAIESTNKLLERQLQLLAELNGTEWISGAFSNIDTITRQLELLEQQIRQTNVQTTNFLGQSGTQNTANWDVEDFITLLNGGSGTSYSGLFGGSLPDLPFFSQQLFFDEQKLQALVDQYLELDARKDELLASLQEELTGTTVDSLVDSIVQGFSEGRLAAVDFAEDFEELMKAAIINSFKREYLEKQLQGWYTSFYEATQGGLTPDEIANLQTAYDEIIAQAEAGFAALQEATGLNFSIIEGAEDAEQRGLAGAIKGITEETAGVLAGQMGAIRINVAEIVANANDSLDALNQIVINTSYNKILEEINNKLGTELDILRSNGT